MTLSRMGKVVESPRGTGRVRRGNDVIARVDYSLTVETQQVFAKSFAGTQQARFEHKTVAGTITVVEGSIAVPAGLKTPYGPLTLTLEDGRELNIQIHSHAVGSTPARPEYMVSGSGNKL